MKFTILLTLLTTLNVSAVLYSQDTKLSLAMKDKTLREVIKDIEGQSNFRFFFSDDYLDLNKKVTVYAQNKGINEILPDLLEQSKITYKVMDNNVVVIIPATAKQTNSINGIITDGGTGEPLIGVNVIVRGTTRGVVTDANGKFSLEAASGETIVVSYVGYLSEEVVLGDQKTITVTLMPDVKKLDEVVVVGYGTVKKTDLTGSVSSIKSSDITKSASSNAMQTMQARMPGVDIQQSDGQAGSGLNIQLRGRRSINASNDPLILVDGVEYGSTLDLNPTDIESIDVLKDASSTAIYGTKGANGVIIITTKRGKAGKTAVNFSAYYSSNKPANVPQVMYGDREVYRLVAKADYEANLATYNSTGTWGTTSTDPSNVLTQSLSDGTSMYSIYQDGSYTNWADIILRDGQTKNYELSVSGGNDKTNYNLSLGLMNEGGLMKKDEMNRYNGKITIDHRISKAFKTGGSVLYTYKDQDARNSSVFGQSMKMTSITHAYLNTGAINLTPNPMYVSHCNPLLDEVDGNYQNNALTSRIFGNTYLEISPFKNLVFKSMFALDRSNARNGVYQDYQSVGRYQAPSNTYISNESTFTTKYTWDNTLNYSVKLAKHDISALIGSSTMQSIYEEAIAFGTAGQEHYYTNSFNDLSKIASTTATSIYTKTSMVSFFGRLNYKFNEKYLFTASLRSDGSSTLAPGQKWGYFPSASAAWRASEESFLSGTKAWLSNFKLRASWGITGNAAVPAYSTITGLSNSPVYYYLGSTSISGNVPNNLGNPNLTWETTAAYNFGVDYGFFNNRVSGTVDYFTSKTTDLLYYVSVPTSEVYATYLDNKGKTKAHGIEVGLNALVAKTKDFSWDMNVSYTTSRDEVTYLSEGVTKNISGTSAYIVGEPITAFYDYEAQRCWNIDEYATYISDWQTRHPGETSAYVAGYGAPGTIKVRDLNDDGKIDNEDKHTYNRAPRQIFGLNNTFTYKNFSLSALLYARVGGYLSYGLNSLITYDNSNWGNLNYWTPDDYRTKIPTPGSNSQTTFTLYGSSLLYEKADYLKIKDITLSYTLPKSMMSKIGIEQIKIYGSLKNYFTFSYLGDYDPERGGSINFPLAKQMVFGINVQF